jgi:preprotein translocase subunit Sss1
MEYLEVICIVLWFLVAVGGIAYLGYLTLKSIKEEKEEK